MHINIANRKVHKLQYSQYAETLRHVIFTAETYFLRIFLENT